MYVCVLLIDIGGAEASFLPPPSLNIFISFSFFLFLLFRYNLEKREECVQKEGGGGEGEVFTKFHDISKRKTYFSVRESALGMSVQTAIANHPCMYGERSQGKK